MGHTAKTPHKWRTEGTLLQNIKSEFNKIPERNRGGYFHWLLNNQYVLSVENEPSSNITASRDEYLKQALMRAWR
eukprot:1083746-Pyramimonas_sp.AAC.1